MDPTTVATALGIVNTLLIAVFGHVYRSIYMERKERTKSVADLDTQVNNFRAEVPTHYVRKEDLREDMQYLKTRIDAVYEHVLAQGRR